MITIFNEIRTKCSLVAESARWMKIHEDRINLYPERLLLGDSVNLSHTSEHHLLGRGDDTVRYFMILDTINFGSGYFPYLDKDGGVSGYFTVAKRLKEHCLEFGIPSSDDLVGLDTAGCAAMLKQPIYSAHIEELMHLFRTALNDLGDWLNSNFGGDYLAIFREYNSANDVIFKLSEMRLYRDRSLYFGMKVPFFKRAQILLQDIKIAFPGNDYIDYPDIDQLTMFADNVLPYVFISDGLLEIDPWLEGRISREELIGSGSPEEIELRACSVYIGERLASIISEDLRPITVRELDFVLWNRGQALKKQVERKRHRTRCSFY